MSEVQPVIGKLVLCDAHKKVATLCLMKSASKSSNKIPCQVIHLNFIYGPLQAGYQDLLLSAVCLQRNCQIKAPMAMLQSINHLCASHQQYEQSQS